MSKKFSIIIPSHNGEERIARALESCFEQTFKDFEVIVVCDACTDNTHLVAQRYDTIITDVNCRRDGLARNAGIDIATGEWILFLDDDDWWLHEYVFQQIYDIVNNSQCDVLNYGIIWRHVGYRIAHPGAILAMCAGHVWRREFIGDTRFDDAQYSSDTHFLDALIKKKPVCCYTALPMYYYNYMRSGSLSDRFKRGEIK